MRLTRALFLAALAGCLPLVVSRAQAGERAATLKACAELFGAPVDAKENLFEVNGLFVLQPKYDPRGRLVELAVFPKHWLEETHPEWTEPPKTPLLAKSEYESLLARLDGVKPRGRLLQAGRGGVVTNMTSYFTDKYEHAFARRGERADEGVRFATVYYAHEVEGTVVKKRRLDFFGERSYQVLVGELNYFVRREEYAKLRVGKAQKFSAVGPIKGYCYGGHCNP